MIGVSLDGSPIYLITEFMAKVSPTIDTIGYVHGITLVLLRVAANCTGKRLQYNELDAQNILGVCVLKVNK